MVTYCNEAAREEAATVVVVVVVGGKYSTNGYVVEAVVWGNGGDWVGKSNQEGGGRFHTWDVGGGGGGADGGAAAAAGDPWASAINRL